MSDFPPSSIAEDSRFFDESMEDRTMKAETDGGYSYTRARNRRRPRKMFKTGFTNLSDSNKEALEQCYAQRQGAVSFTYSHPVSGVEHVVRFKDGQSPKWKYRGFGDNPRWDVADVMLVEV